MLNVLLQLLIAVTLLALIATRLKAPYPLLLVVGGLALGQLPLAKGFRLNPELVFQLFLPPLLYQAAWLTSWHDLRVRIRPIAQMVVLLVVGTVGAVAFVAHALLGLPWAISFVLGAIVSPTDSVAPVAIARRLGVPRTLITIVEGESLFNDATGLVLWRVAVAAVVTGSFSLLHTGAIFVVDAVGGIALGLAAGFLISRLHRGLDEPSIETTLTLLTPFAVWTAAELLTISGVLAVVTAGLFISHSSSRTFGSRLRLQATPVWRTLTFILEGLLFILLGLELRNVPREVLATGGWGSLFLNVVLLGLVVTAVRLLWIFPQARLSRLRVHQREPVPPWQDLLVLGWMGLRGAVSMATALAVPLTTATGSPFPERERLILLTSGVIVWTLLFQGLTLPLLIRRVGLHSDVTPRDEELNARIAAAHAALARIDELDALGHEEPELARALRRRHEALLQRLEAQLSPKEAAPEAGSHLGVVTQRQRDFIQDVIGAERAALLRMREEGELHDDTYQRLERQLDLQEERLELAAFVGDDRTPR